MSDTAPTPSTESPPVLEAARDRWQPESKADLPPLPRDGAFLGMAATQFLGAFNDNLFKQLLLLLSIPVGAAAALRGDTQWLANIVFALPFILFSGFAGYLSDRYPKRRIIVASKVAEIVAMLLGVGAFLMFPITGFTGLLVVLFLMGVQSAFFGPGKYGILPEMLRERDLPRANGVILMLTFLAIILGTALAGLLPDRLVNQDLPLRESASRLAWGSGLCVMIAVVGTGTSLLIRKCRPANPRLRLAWSSLAVPPETRRLLYRDFSLALALLASCMFWLVSGIAIPAVNSLGKIQLELDDAWRNTLTSFMTAAIGLGIAGGAVMAGKLSRGRADFRIMRSGAWGIIVSLLLLTIWLPGGAHLLGFYGSVPVLIALGVSAGLFAIPLQVFLQSRPPAEQKGRMIATMNLANFIAILISGLLYYVFDKVAVGLELPRSVLFFMMALLMLPVAVFYRPPEHT